MLMAPSTTDDLSLNGVETSNGHVESTMVNIKSSNPVFVLREKNQFYYETRLMPPPPLDHSVTIAVHATGLCGSDVRSPNPSATPYHRFYLFNALTSISRSIIGLTAKSANSKSSNPSS
jgi:hypothetical protein